MNEMGLIKGFGRYTAPQLEKMRTDLGISMPTAKLSYCASYYTAARRDPFIEELKMLDRLYLRQADTVANAAPTRLFTNDDFVAHTYADMMKKRNELKPSAAYPCTLSELSSLCSLYLARAGKALSSEHASASVRPLDARTPSGGLSASVANKSRRFVLQMFEKLSDRAFATGDLILLIAARSQLALKTAADPLSVLANDAVFCALCKSVRPITERGLLYTLLSMSDGMTVYPEKCSRTGEPVPLSVLSDGYVGQCVVRIAREDLETAARRAATLGLSVFSFAQTTHDDRFTFVRKNGTSFCLNSGFLRAMATARAVQVELGDERSFVPSAIDHTPLSSADCKYLISQTDHALPQVQATKHTLCAVSSTAPSESLFQNALDCTLTAVMSLCAQGIPHTEQALSVGMTVPAWKENTASVSSAVSVLLGLYRLQAELALPLSSPVQILAGQTSAPDLTVFSAAKAKDKTVAAGFCAAGHRIYCLSPRMTETGLYDFASLRTFLTQLAALSQSGAVKSARVLAHESLSDALRAMRQKGLFCRLADPTLVMGDAIRMAVLVETDRTLEATLVGTVEQKQPEQTAATPRLLPERSCLLAGADTKVVLVASETDADAMMLAEVLREHGASVRVFSPAAKDVAPLARAICSSRTLLVCGVALPKDPKVAFAADTLGRAGGYLLTVGGGRCGLDIPVFACPDGIGREMIEQICRSSES